MNKHRDIALIVIKLNNHELKTCYTQEERIALESMTTHIYFPTLKGKSTFDQTSHDIVVKLATNLGIV